MAEVQKLRRGYESGIKTNDELRGLLESERDTIHDRSRSSDGILELRLQLDESLQENGELKRQLNESARLDDEFKRLRYRLNATKVLKDSLWSRIKEMKESSSTVKEVRAEAVKLQKELQDERRLNKQETRKSAEEIGRERRLREVKMMYEQLDKQLDEILNHSAKMKNEIEK